MANIIFTVLLLLGLPLEAAGQQNWNWNNAEPHQLNNQASNYEQFLVVHDVAVRYINGNLRFCPRFNLRGNVCGQEENFFGKRKFMVRDWFYPETYIEAVTGRRGATVTRVTPSPDGYGLTIYFN